jgi:outer membrane lipoprotein SlyB
VAGATVATAGAFEGGKANPVHRNYVQRCVTEKGLEIIGWN